MKPHIEWVDFDGGCWLCSLVGRADDRYQHGYGDTPAEAYTDFLFDARRVQRNAGKVAECRTVQ